MPRKKKKNNKDQRISVMLVEPKFQGNIGAVARVMKNFGLKDLVLVRPYPLEEEAYQRAMHSKDVLDKSRKYKTFSRAIARFDYVVGTTRESTKNDKKHIRKAITPRELVKHLKTVDGKVALLFGREDYGLYNTEIADCDILVTIPASDEYPILNVSHAVGIVLYELFMAKAFLWKPPPSTDFERKKLMTLFENYMQAIKYPKHKKKKASVMFKRIVGRAKVSKWEFHTVMGLFSRAIKRIDRLERSKR